MKQHDNKRRYLNRTGYAPCYFFSTLYLTLIGCRSGLWTHVLKNGVPGSGSETSESVSTEHDIVGSGPKEDFPTSRQPRGARRPHQVRTASSELPTPQVLSPTLRRQISCQSTRNLGSVLLPCLLTHLQMQSRYSTDSSLITATAQCPRRSSLISHCVYGTPLFCVVLSYPVNDTYDYDSERMCLYPIQPSQRYMKNQSSAACFV